MERFLHLQQEAAFVDPNGQEPADPIDPSLAPRFITLPGSTTMAPHLYLGMERVLAALPVRPSPCTTCGKRDHAGGDCVERPAKRRRVDSGDVSVESEISAELELVDEPETYERPVMPRSLSNLSDSTPYYDRSRDPRRQLSDSTRSLSARMGSETSSNGSRRKMPVVTARPEAVRALASTDAAERWLQPEFIARELKATLTLAAGVLVQTGQRWKLDGVKDVIGALDPLWSEDLLTKRPVRPKLPQDWSSPPSRITDEQISQSMLDALAYIYGVSDQSLITRDSVRYVCHFHSDVAQWCMSLEAVFTQRRMLDEIVWPKLKQQLGAIDAPTAQLRLKLVEDAMSSRPALVKFVDDYKALIAAAKPKPPPPRQRTESADKAGRSQHVRKIGDLLVTKNTVAAATPQLVFESRHKPAQLKPYASWIFCLQHDFDVLVDSSSEQAALYFTRKPAKPSWHCRHLFLAWSLVAAESQSTNPTNAWPAFPHLDGREVFLPVGLDNRLNNFYRNGIDRDKLPALQSLVVAGLERDNAPLGWFERSVRDALSYAYARDITVQEVNWVLRDSSVPRAFRLLILGLARLACVRMLLDAGGSDSLWSIHWRPKLIDKYGEEATRRFKDFKHDLPTSL